MNNREAGDLRRYRAHYDVIETVSPEGTFCDTVQVPSRGADMDLI